MARGALQLGRATTVRQPDTGTDVAGIRRRRPRVRRGVSRRCAWFLQGVLPRRVDRTAISVAARSLTVIGPPDGVICTTNWRGRPWLENAYFCMTRVGTVLILLLAASTLH